VGGSAGAGGTWPSYWWASPIYPTAIALDLWAAAGRPGPDRARPSLPQAASSFEQSWQVIAAIATEDHAASTAGLEALLRAQDPDGGWPSGRFLVVPSPARSGVAPAAPPTGDARRLLTTASAVMALTRALGQLVPVSFVARRRRPV